MTERSISSKRLLEGRPGFVTQRGLVVVEEDPVAAAGQWVAAFVQRVVEIADGILQLIPPQIDL